MPQTSNKITKTPEELANATQFPRVFYCRHMQPGTVKYENDMVLADTDTIKRMMPSAVGKPVYIHHQKVDLATMKEKAAGYITDSFYNEVDGWCWFKFLAIDDEAYSAILQDWSVSNAYLVTNWGEGGTKNNVPYDREVLTAIFTHLAIVPDPRYEGACIMSPEKFREYQDTKKRELEVLHNSKTPVKGTAMAFKFFKNEKKEVSTVDADCSVELENGKVVTVGEMINAMCKNSEDEEKAKKAKEEKENSDEQTVEVAGEVMPLKELINRFTKMNEKKNAEEAEEKKKKADEEKANAAAAEEEKKKKEEEEKTNAAAGKKHFDELKNANQNTEAPVMVIETSANKLARGKERY